MRTVDDFVRSLATWYLVCSVQNKLLVLVFSCFVSGTGRCTQTCCRVFRASLPCNALRTDALSVKKARLKKAQFEALHSSALH